MAVRVCAMAGLVPGGKRGGQKEAHLLVICASYLIPVSAIVVGQACFRRPIWPEVRSLGNLQNGRCNAARIHV